MGAFFLGNHASLRSSSAKKSRVTAMLRKAGRMFASGNALRGSNDAGRACIVTYLISPGALATLVLIWGALIVFGAGTVLRYERTAGASGTPPSRWPVESAIARPSGKFILVMLSHPDCPCTKASLDELEIVMAETQREVSAVILFNRPGSTAAEVESSDLWKMAARIPGVTPIYDEHAAGVQSFHGYVSGQTMLYDPNGLLVFSGGITLGRGHEGYNGGVDAILRRVRGDRSAPISARVFGCALHDPSAQTTKEDPSWRN